MFKQYGLILPEKRSKRPTSSAKDANISGIFKASSSDSDQTDNAPSLNTKSGTTFAASATEKRRSRRLQEKALAEDPTVYQYDELYDEMEMKRKKQQSPKSDEPKKAKYIGILLETSERRKLEYERHVERQVQKEREQEGEEFKDKDSFVTAAYRQKLEDMRMQEELEKRDDYLEAIGDVTKQKDLDGFYRHLYEQKMGDGKEIKKPAVSVGTDNNEIGYSPIKSGKPQQQRAYRKRHSSDEEEKEPQPTKVQREHLANNIDADSDFSIDSSNSSESEKKSIKDVKKIQHLKSKNNRNKKQSSNSKKTNSKQNEGKVANATKENVAEEIKNNPNENDKHEDGNKDKLQTVATTNIETTFKQPKLDVWKKRTVGTVLEDAIQNYLKRKKERNA